MKKGTIDKLSFLLKTIGINLPIASVIGHLVGFRSMVYEELA